MRSFSQNVVRPNMPLRRPLTSPVGAPTTPVSPSGLTSPTAMPLRPLAVNLGDGDGSSVTARDNSLLIQHSSIPPAMTVNLCNYCSHQGNFQCMHCKKTFYCSKGCQSEDWKAHRHVCRSSTPDPAVEKPKESTASLVMGDGANLLEPKVNHSDASCRQRVYFGDLKKNNIAKGTEIQASLTELHSPGRFFLHNQCTEMLEALRSISTELQRTYSGCPPGTAYMPNLGEVCAVQFSHDLNWYRGLVQSVAADQKTANILYIDFGNEEDVPMARIKPLAANIPLIAPCAMECCVAGVVPVTGIWTGEASIALRQLLVGKRMTVSVADILQGGRVHAVDILLSFIGKQLSTFLSDQGYAVKEAVTIKPTEQDINSLVSASLENFKRRSTGMDENTGSQLPEPLTQGLGDSFSAVVTHLCSPHEIICQKVENASVIQDLQLKLRDQCCQVPASQNFRPAPGTACCSQFSEDNQWYRAKVLAYSSEERVCVGYIDFGNSEEVELGRLRPLSASLLALPMQALPCALAGVQPVGETWSEECVLTLQQRVSNRILQVKILGELEGAALVAMLDKTSDPQADVAELLLSAGYAAPATDGHQEAKQTTAAAREPEVSIPACEPLVWSCAELPCDGQTVVLLISIVENPGEFHCYIYNPEDLQKLMELGDELKKHCEADATAFSPKVGEPCCAMFPGDGAWYRAMVQELFEDKAAVYFVDYGNSAQVHKDHLRVITSKLLILPFQALRCWLTGVEPLDSGWSSEALLWFQSLVVNQQLSARVVKVTERGYGLELEISGKSVAAALLSEQLAKVPAEPAQPPAAAPRETHASTGSPNKEPERKETEHLHAQASNQTGAGSKDAPVEELTVATPSAAASFPVDWKSAELPQNEDFQPRIAAVMSPSLFYLLSPSQVDLEKLQHVMMELAVYCSTNQASYASCPVQSRPAPGAACCAKFSGDKSWYRAVVLEANESEASVVYADYGNSERVPYTSILPIPQPLLQLPFHIARCALTGKDHFPQVWPAEVLQFFESLLSDGVRATVQTFDGSTNVLSATLRTERGGGHITAMILKKLQAQAKSPPSPAPTLKADPTDHDTSSASAAAAAVAMTAPDRPEPNSTNETEKGPERTTTTAGPAAAAAPELTQTPQKEANVSEVSVNGWSSPQKSGCCCLALKTKIDNLEQLMQLQLSLIKQIARQGKSCEPLVWSCAELPCDGQTVVLLVCIVENPGEFHCYIYNPEASRNSVQLLLHPEMMPDDYPVACWEFSRGLRRGVDGYIRSGPTGC
ncbi:tudor domain-containing protein 1 [Polymixia lowei]